MQNSVLDTAYILINVHPVIYFFAIERLLGIFRIAVAHIIPARADERIHRIALTARRAAADGASGIDKLGHIF